jgi:hypothetical protein
MNKSSKKSESNIQRSWIHASKISRVRILVYNSFLKKEKEGGASVAFSHLCMLSVEDSKRKMKMNDRLYWINESIARREEKTKERCYKIKQGKKKRKIFYFF